MNTFNNSDTDYLSNREQLFRVKKKERETENKKGLFNMEQNKYPDKEVYNENSDKLYNSNNSNTRSLKVIDRSKKKFLNLPIKGYIHSLI